jgi:tRNA (adenine37-N6)-methyltransferase
MEWETYEKTPVLWYNRTVIEGEGGQQAKTDVYTKDGMPLVVSYTEYKEAMERAAKVEARYARELYESEQKLNDVLKAMANSERQGEKIQQNVSGTSTPLSSPTKNKTPEEEEACKTEESPRKKEEGTKEKDSNRSVAKDKTTVDPLVAAFQQEIKKLNQLREEERRGRIKAEQSLRENLLQKQEKDGYIYHSIGTLRSCYPTRNGTPRQPQLVPSGRATIKLSKHIPSSSLNSLDQFSHCWILFVFNGNTNMHQQTSTNKSKTTIKGKVKPPQLNGKKVGLYSTRTPHRPNNIGLSVAKIVNVNENTKEVYLNGIDIIDGTTILDIKPYLPFDIVDMNKLNVPKWVDDNDIFKALPVEIVNSGDNDIRNKLVNYVKYNKSVWWKPNESEDFINTIKEILALDIRSKHQGRGDATGKNNKQKLINRIGGGNDIAPRIYTLNLDQKSTEIKFVTNESGVHVVDVLYD